MMACTLNGSTRLTDDSGSQDLHVALTYAQHSEYALKSLLGATPEYDAMLVVMFDVLHELKNPSYNDLLRRDTSTVISMLDCVEADHVIGEWQCMLTAVLLLKKADEAVVLRLYEVLRGIADALTPPSGKRVYCAASSCFTDPERLPQAADEAYEAVKFARYIENPPKLIVPLDQLSLCEQYPPLITAGSDRNFTESLSQIIRMLQSGTPDQLEKIADRCSMVMLRVFPRISALHFNAVSFGRALEQALLQANIIGIRQISELRIIPELLEAEDEAHFRRALCEQLRELWKYSNQKKYSRFADSMEDAMSFIDDNLKNPALSITMIADALEISIPTLTSRFQRFYGDSIPNTIHKKRISQIREKLLCSEEPIRQVASEYGYVSIATFNRAFLKYEGSYPGALRAQRRNKES